MYLLDINEKSILLLIIIISFILNSIYIYLTINYQKKINFLHPAWLIIAVLFLYGQLTPIYFFFVKIENITNPLLLRLFNFDDFIKIYIVYIFVTVVFFILDLLIYSNLKYQPNYYKVEKLKESQEVSIFLTGCIFYVLGIIIYIYNFNTINSVDSSFIFDKTQRLNGEEIEAGLNHTSFYITSFLFLFNSFYITRIKPIKIIIIIMFLVFSFMIFYLGTTLQVFLMIISFFYITYKYDVVKFKKLVISSSILIPLFYLLVQFSEAYRVYKLKLTNKIDLTNIFDFSSFESITGYISGFIFLNTNGIKHEYNMGDLIFGLLPGSFGRLIGEEGKNVTEIINGSPFVSSNGLYVPTLPISILFNIGITVLILIIAYLTISLLFIYLNKKSISKFILSIMLYIELFYLLRINIEAWLGKLRFDLVILVFALLLYKTLNNLFKNNKRERKY
ncbi:O-antigen polymerase [Staphylococcus equorum]|uniref:O-antigen polymerase n=1 Tax=Staphylococcus equorum TaxID=246432 RepID=UPI0008FB4F6A|nr:O-antigen polymerase [Staphylococcus equorum]OIS62109.1 hypothetical protein A4A34_00040 [Staphylococcus equorum]